MKKAIATTITLAIVGPLAVFVYAMLLGFEPTQAQSDGAMALLLGGVFVILGAWIFVDVTGTKS
jgi:hypothetical protein